MFPFDDHIAFDEFQRQRTGGSRRKALRLPAHRPQPKQKRDDDSGDDTPERGVRVLDMSNGYSVVE